jgi:hypothetical protein
LLRHAKIGWERDFNPSPLNSIPADVVIEFLQRAVWGVNCRAAWIIPDVRLPLIQRQAQDARLLGVAQRHCGKQDKNL